MAKSARIALSIVGSESPSADLGTISKSLSASITQSFAEGTGNDQINLIWQDTRTLTTGANEELDLASTAADADKVALATEFGTTVNFGKVKVLYIKNKSTARTLTVGGAASQAWEAFTTAAATVNIPPDGFLLLMAPDAGWTVDETHDLLKIANDSGSSCEYDIVVLGLSA